MQKHKTVGGLSIAEEFASVINRRRKKNTLMRILPICLLIALIVLFGIITPKFLTFSNLYTNLLTQMSVLLVIAVGSTFVILTGGIDLSIEGVVGFAGCFLGLLVQNTANAADLGIFGVLIAIGVTTLISTLIGVIHVKLKLPSFIVTFSAGYIVHGIGVLTYKGIPATIVDEGVRNLYFEKFLELPYISWIAFGILLIGLFLERKTAFGRYVFAIGDNEKIPVMSGVNVGMVKIKAFAFAGFCMGVAGLMGGAKLGTAQIYIGQDYLFPTLTAVVVGGTSMSGGKGGVLNTLIGVLIVTILENGMVMIGVPSEWQQCVQGLIIIFMVVLTSSRIARQIVK